MKDVTISRDSYPHVNARARILQTMHVAHGVACTGGGPQRHRRRSRRPPVTAGTFLRGRPDVPGLAGGGSGGAAADGAAGARLQDHSRRPDHHTAQRHPVPDQADDPAPGPRALEL